MQRFLSGIALIILLLGLGSCASTPTQTDNACAVLSQKNGFFHNWGRSAKKAEREYGIPMPVILATINTESGFKQRAKPPRRKLLGFIPWKRQSSAYGYGQALSGTWEHYKKSTGHHGASRTSFDDVAQFIAWYHRGSVVKNNVRPDDAYSLYLNYQLGHAAYARGQTTPAAVAAARRTQRMAERYDRQLRNCGRR
ncbi:MAG: hypothetical protein DU429_05220 [Candidatus Tokpelaia sp.]|nr:MAG: hypothetical protein DU430_07830 [Candidatus Tokpelaia sp.]KAA6206863.1 MAG: hypothetical protein DU429_05220 [Candidatus Tokpelaia sp.]